MSEPEPSPAPVAVAVEFRSASSLLIAYSVNLSRGGLFVELDRELRIGAPVEVTLIAPGVVRVSLRGHVAWQRGTSGDEGPRGVGLEFDDIGLPVGQIIDQLVAEYRGMSIVVIAHDPKIRSSLARQLKSIVTSAEVSVAADGAVVEALLSDEVDLAVVELDGNRDLGLAAMRLARAQQPPVPVVVMASSKRLRDQAREAGADELTDSPPGFDELQLAVVRALGRPIAIR